MLNHAIDPQDRFGNYGYYGGDGAKRELPDQRVPAALPGEVDAAMNKSANVEPAGA